MICKAMRNGEDQRQEKSVAAAVSTLRTLVTSYFFGTFYSPAQKYGTLPEVWHMQSGAHHHV